MLIKSVVTFLSFPCKNRGKRFTMFNNEADSSRKKKREREKLRFKISLCPTIRGGLTFSHCAIPMHTHTIRPHYVIRAERYFDLDRSMILWRDCALFACDCINDTCKKRRRKKRKKKKKTLPSSRSRTWNSIGRSLRFQHRNHGSRSSLREYQKKEKKKIITRFENRLKVGTMSSLAISFLFITQRDSFIRDTIREFCRVNAIPPLFSFFHSLFLK